MRKLTLIAFASAAAVAPSAAFAAPPACKDLLHTPDDTGKNWEQRLKDVDDAFKKALLKDPKAVKGDVPAIEVTPEAVDCLNDNVLVIAGNPTMAKCGTKKDPKDDTLMVPDYGNCTLDYAKVVARAVELMGTTQQYDELVVFGQQMAPSSNPPAPLFYRDGITVTTDPVTKVSTAMGTGVNEVDGIGLPLVPRVAGHPYVGYIAAGSTAQAAKFGDASSDKTIWMNKYKKEDWTGPIGSYGPCGKAPKAPTDQPGDQAAPAICFPSFYNYFDALGQATASLYGPYLKGPKDPVFDPMTMKFSAGSPLVVEPVVNGSASTKTGFLTEVDQLDPMTMMPIPDPAKPGSNKKKKIPSAAYVSLQPRYWNSLLDTKGSLFAGNTYRDNANGTFETTKPPAVYGINVPFPAGWKAGTVLAGSQILRFQPLDLYAMGLLSPDEPLHANEPALKDQIIRSFITQTPLSVYRDGRTGVVTAFDAKAGPQMGQRTGFVIRPVGTMMDNQIAVSEIIKASGTRPATPHFVKQLWVVVSKPVEWTTADSGEDMNDKYLKIAIGLQHLNVMGAIRRQFEAYYYMLTQYRGRVISTVDSVDDNSYYEFGFQQDDEKMFKLDDPGRGKFIDQERPNPNAPDIRNMVRFMGVAPGTGISFAGAAPGLRIIGDQTVSRTPNNSVQVRMRIPTKAATALKGATAKITFNDGGVEVQIPNSPATLVPDGKWHTYTATLDKNDMFKGGTFTGFSFAPANKVWDSGNDVEGVELEFIRVGHVASTKDGDKQQVTCDVCDKQPGAAKKQCNDQCAADSSKPVQVDLNDGWIDSEDNCPGVYNPNQEDGNDDGVGDACEDFDGDGVVNAWDNCPTVTNSRQRDQDGNGAGDVCDGNPPAPCFLKPDSLGGPISSRPGTTFVVAFAGLAGLIAVRRRRRSR
jgi:hypothetical protein